MITFHVQPNDGATTRTASLRVGDGAFAITQGPCLYQFVLERGPAGIDSAGGIRALQVRTPEGCRWTVTTPDPFVRFPAIPTGKGSGSFEYCVAANRGATRYATFEILGADSSAELELSQSGFDPPLEGCQPGATSLCLLGNQFEVRLAFSTSSVQGAGNSVQLNQRAGYFTFFDSTNPEILLKMIDGRPVNNHFWLFYGALSSVGYVITATDTVTGEAAFYCNPTGTFRSWSDTLAFPRP
jgi:hypothetical protein